MSNTTKRALIVIDVQNDYNHGNLPIEFPPVERSLHNIGKAMDGATLAAIPVVVVQNVMAENMPVLAKGTHGAELHPFVSARHHDHFINKDFPGAFTGTDLEAWLRTNQIDTITIVGFMTHNCNFSTAVQAMHAGFAVEFIADAAGSLPYSNRAGSATAEEIHRVFSVVMQSRFAAVLTTDEWLSNVKSGTSPLRDSIYKSNQLARLEAKNSAGETANQT